MYHDAQITAQWWEQLLFSTGGKLELTKCFYHPILWHFDDEGIPSPLNRCEEAFRRHLGIVGSFLDSIDVSEEGLSWLRWFGSINVKN